MRKGGGGRQKKGHRPSYAHASGKIGVGAAVCGGDEAVDKQPDPVRVCVI
jgi:hypothetical protein